MESQQEQPILIQQMEKADQQRKRSEHRVAQIRQTFVEQDLDADEVAAILDLDRSTVLRYLRNRELIGYQIGREWRIPVAELENYKRSMLDRNRRAAMRASTEEEARRKFEIWQRTQPWRSNRLEPCRNCETLMVTWLDTFFSDQELRRQFGRKGQCGFCGDPHWMDVDPIDWADHPDDLREYAESDQRRVELLQRMWAGSGDAARGSDIDVLNEPTERGA